MDLPIGLPKVLHTVSRSRSRCSNEQFQIRLKLGLGYRWGCALTFMIELT